MTGRPNGLAIVAAILAVAVIGATWLLAERTRLSSEVAEVRQQLEVARGDAGAEIAALEKANADLSTDLAESSAARDLAEDELAGRNAVVEGLRTELDDSRARAAADLERLEAYERLLGSAEALVTMPDLEGLSLADAEALAAAVGATLLTEQAAPSNVIARPGTIIAQLPAVGTALVQGSVIWIQVFAPR